MLSHIINPDRALYQSLHVQLEQIMKSACLTLPGLHCIDNITNNLVLDGNVLSDAYMDIITYRP